MAGKGVEKSRGVVGKAVALGVVRKGRGVVGKGYGVVEKAVGKTKELNSPFLALYLLRMVEIS